ncbi:atrial natriuretic peptide-converting enzyme-like [Physella acuta]|uniref:atrial natriuretic peptide-converting enzyme-like n=1 Tax=Physella acuta TaxID=109671 RepID=UPI0027DB7013|nr:atrial natriuretic peptide-converting enzyme-like [Physella acuta]XP_059158262.1 atrial natriuretic peptide-converting enzyme-like [Physella acuta]XP_059158263.1 atrial natriuretic peptide-converting enzyme-like [Physella acuta]
MPSPHNSRKYADHVRFTSLETAEPVTLGTDGTAATLTPTVKVISPYISLKAALVIFLVVTTLILAIVCTAVVLHLVLNSQTYVDQQVGNTTSSTNSTPAADVTTETTWTASTITPTTSTATTPNTTTTTPTSSTAITTPNTTTPTHTTATTTTPATTTSTTTTTQTTTPKNICPAQEFMCADLECLPQDVVCDGIPDCRDGSDEGVNCACAIGQFKCPNGQCIPQHKVCDGDYDCIDSGDEMNCPNCDGFSCVSNKLCLWDNNQLRCNDMFNCDDLSDEVNCTRGSSSRECRNGVKVIPSLWCDGLDDCGDNSDEEKCDCRGNNLYSCSPPSGQCIQRTQVCDGVKDCRNGRDEMDCARCRGEMFQCVDYTCVNTSQHCDGNVDCKKNGGDEDDCAQVLPSAELEVTISDVRWSVCWDNWLDIHGAHVCSSLNKRYLKAWPSDPTQPDQSRYATLKPGEWNSGKPLVSNFMLSDLCASGQVVHIQCVPKGECGERKTPILESSVAGGGITPLGKWPWVVSLAFLDKPICGGVLISSRLVLTAAHCIIFPVPLVGRHDLRQTPFYFTVVAGATSYLLDQATPTGGQQMVRVAKIDYHNMTAVQENGGVAWDLALLQLEQELVFSDVVQPLCLPAPGAVFLPSSQCYLAGWGLLNSRQYMKPSRLRDARMMVWTEERCRRNVVAGEAVVDTNSTICTGYIMGRPTGCQGDSGGPLMCLDPTSGVYVLAGIMSQSSTECGRLRTNLPANRFARVSTAVDWIQEIQNSLELL